MRRQVLNIGQTKMEPHSHMEIIQSMPVEMGHGLALSIIIRQWPTEKLSLKMVEWSISKMLISPALENTRLARVIKIGRAVDAIIRQEPMMWLRLKMVMREVISVVLENTGLAHAIKIGLALDITIQRQHSLFIYAFI